MASTVFVNGSTLTDAAWFNDVNTVTYTLFGNGSAYTGALTLGSSGNIAVNTNKFTVAASSGNTLIAGTLALTGAATFSSTLAAGATTVTGTVTATSGFVGPSSLAYFLTQEMNTLAGNTSIAITGAPNGSLIVMRDITDGGVAVFLAEGGVTPTLISQTGSNMNAGDSGSSTSKICLYNNAGTISVYNRYATAKRISMNIIAPH